MIDSPSNSSARFEPLPSGFGRFTAIVDDHRELGGMLAELRRLCAARIANEPSAFESEAAGLLAALRAALLHHFAREEADDYFGVVVSERPALIPRVAELRAEHTAFLEVVGSLTQASSGAESLQAAHDALEFFSALGAHERRETELLSEFFDREP